MTVKELIEALSKFPEDMRVCIPNEDFGDTDVIGIRLSKDYEQGNWPPFVLVVG
ncbi:hypothetical protein J1C56_01985 [Aminobacter anthyllidis]|uniref:Uncharacterized protein n=1 Tax=Aminobacter anthyllidis TaxID=1035067 RepID=A0A9X1D446_9HYPH|nr:hypothetical protein [Aminobacter anthyllidis]MBT1154354.1 hypothetical protein [Aminobacter anthyllidis]